MPAPLPPVPRLTFEGDLQLALERAVLAIGRLDGVSALLPDKALFLYAYIRKEAVLSSQIEGTRSSLSDLLLFELDEAPGVPLDDVVEVSNYVAALEHGLHRLREGFPLSNRLIRETHGVLLSRGRGSGKDPGEFRRSQNWIGGSRPGNAVFVPPPHTLVPECIAALERFLHATADGLPVLVRAGLAHVQFETIHLFLDGNGRVGRLLITFLLCHAGVLGEPLLYLSLYLNSRTPSSAACSSTARTPAPGTRAPFVKRRRPTATRCRAATGSARPRTTTGRSASSRAPWWTSSSRRNRSCIGVTGAHFVACRLSLRELVVPPTIWNAAGMDLLVRDHQTRAQASLQVKTALTITCPFAGSRTGTRSRPSSGDLLPPRSGRTSR